MHVCHFITTLERGGAQSLVRDIINHDESGIVHSVCYFGDDTALESELVEAGADVVRVGDPSYSDIPRIVRNLRLYLQRKDVDVLHTHLIHATVLGRVAGTLGGVGGIVSSIHNVRRNFTRVERFSERVSRPIDDATIAVSEAVRQSFEVSNRWKTIPNGVPTDEFNRRVVTADISVIPKGARGEGPTFLNVARYVPEKNQSILVRAMESVISHRPSASLLVVGRGPEENRLRQLVKQHDIGDSVYITGEVPNIHPYFAVADWFVLSSMHEGLPITVLEAMAAGLPVISADIPGIRGVVIDGETGVLLENVSSHTLAEAFVHINEKQREVMADRTREHVKTKFDIDVVTSNYRRVYHRVA
jgi:glycosyltransferase involved in cell wall biosynthesis